MLSALIPKLWTYKYQNVNSKFIVWTSENSGIDGGLNFLLSVSYESGGAIRQVLFAGANVNVQLELDEIAGETANDK